MGNHENMVEGQLLAVVASEMLQVSMDMVVI
jgi:hypothetical protein